jgi:hypothetical protein
VREFSQQILPEVREFNRPGILARNGTVQERGSLVSYSASRGLSEWK